MSGRQVWWMCSGDHVGVVSGWTSLDNKRMLSLMLSVHKTHMKKHPLCLADTMTIAARRDSLTEEKGRLVFQVPKNDTKHKQSEGLPRLQGEIT